MKTKIDPVCRRTDAILEELRKAGGYYLCPKGSDGKWNGPVVGYAGRYDDGSGKQIQFVGREYADFSVFEEKVLILSKVIDFWNPFLKREILEEVFKGAVFCGMPEGGKAVALLLALSNDGCRYVFPEKRQISEATNSGRAVTEMFWGRHCPKEGDSVFIVEDVCNSFSTTSEAIRLIESVGAKVSAILCLFNRSEKFEDVFTGDDSDTYSIPILALARKRIAQFRQDDPEVADDIARGNVVWKPKHERERLAKAMSG